MFIHNMEHRDVVILNNVKDFALGLGERLCEMLHCVLHDTPKGYEREIQTTRTFLHPLTMEGYRR